MEKSDWFMPKPMYRSEFDKSIDSRDTGNDGYFKVLYCHICKKAHESIWEDNNIKLNYYVDFPSLGLKRKICDRCNQ